MMISKTRIQESWAYHEVAGIWLWLIMILEDAPYQYIFITRYYRAFICYALPALNDGRYNAVICLFRNTLYLWISRPFKD
jgi:hypothetical protein